MGFAIISEVDHGVPSWNGWAQQYVAYDRTSRGNVAIQPATVHNTVTAITDATVKAGRSGTVIFNVGHGAQGPDPLRYPFEGVLDIAPHNLIRLVGTNQDPSRFVSVFYDVGPGGTMPGKMYDTQLLLECKNKKSPPSSQACASARVHMDNWQKYQMIGQTIAQSNIYKVVLLTCRVGGSPEFVHKIANDWNVPDHGVQALRGRR